VALSSHIHEIADILRQWLCISQNLQRERSDAAMTSPLVIMLHRCYTALFLFGRQFGMIIVDAGKMMTEAYYGKPSRR
jgi:hypothetical protein